MYLRYNIRGDQLDFKLSELQLDALKEVGNIGSGNAATALSQMINRRIDMSLPEIRILPFEEMIKKIGSQDEVVVAILLKVFGGAPGNLLLVLDNQKSQVFSDMFLKGFTNVSEEMRMSVFQEVGNIMANSYINAIAKLTNLNLVSSVPSIAVDMLTSILTISFIDAEQFSDHVLAFDTKFTENDQEIGAHFFYIPKPGSLSKILANLGL
jgi:chemotaxis protein CheC